MHIAGRLSVAFCLLLSALAAKADNFKMNILDPPPIGNYGLIQTSTFSFNFVPCTNVALPPGNSADGCFVGQNGTGVDITEVDFSIPNTAGVQGLSATCALDTNGEIFHSVDCPSGPDPNNLFQLGFFNGAITPAQFFIFTESGVDPALFPTVDVNLTLATTPEPSSLVLLASGAASVLSMGYRSRRRRGV